MQNNNSNNNNNNNTNSQPFNMSRKYFNDKL